MFHFYSPLSSSPRLLVSSVSSDQAEMKHSSGLEGDQRTPLKPPFSPSSHPSFCLNLFSSSSLSQLLSLSVLSPFVTSHFVTTFCLFSLLLLSFVSLSCSFLHVVPPAGFLHQSLCLSISYLPHSLSLLIFPAQPLFVFLCLLFLPSRKTCLCHFLSLSGLFFCCLPLFFLPLWRTGLAVLYFSYCWQIPWKDQTITKSPFSKSHQDWTRLEVQRENQEPSSCTRPVACITGGSDLM